MRGEEKLGTVCGGLCTLVILIMFFSLMAVNVVETLENPSFAQTNTVDYVSNSINAPKFDIDTKNSTIALKINNGTIADTMETAKTLRILFLVQSRDGPGSGVPIITYPPAVLCKDFYAEEIEAEDSVDGFYTTSFAGDGWICPNTTGITLWNNLYSTVGAYSVLQAEVRTCSYVKGIVPESFYDNTEAGDIDCGVGFLETPNVTGF